MKTATMLRVAAIVAVLTLGAALLAALPQDPGGRRAARSGGFAPNAFPPTLSDTAAHRDGWWRNDCLRCHETGVMGAPVVVHEGLPELTLRAKCRSCHVLIPGSAPRPLPPRGDPRFDAHAFPPRMPASSSHRASWWRNDCLLCHESGVKGAPLVRHGSLPRILLRAKCRSCHVQVRAAQVPGDPDHRR